MGADSHSATLRLLRLAYKGREHTWQYKAAIENLENQRLDDDDAPPAVEPPTKKPRKCSRCDEVGHRSDRCPLGVTLPEALDRQLDVAPPSPPPVRDDRFARIEAMARSRRGQAS